MKGFTIKASMSELVTLGEGGDKTVGVKVFLTGCCREEVLVIKDEVGSVDGFGAMLGVWCTNTKCEGVKV